MKLYPNVRDMEHLWDITWGELTALEPRLEELLWAARAASATCRRWSDVDQAFAPIRDTLAGLIGFSSTRCGHPILGSVGAYEVAYWRLYDAVAGLLPPPDHGCREVAVRAEAVRSAKVETHRMEWPAGV